jgi:MFS family permease
MKIPDLRWWIAGLLFFAAVLNYVDKNTLALLAPTIQKDLGLTDQDYANIQNAFQVAYTIALLASGAIVDKLGPRVALALFVGWWSVANVFTAAARSVMSLGVFRFLLGEGARVGDWNLHGRYADRDDAGANLRHLAGGGAWLAVGVCGDRLVRVGLAGAVGVPVSRGEDASADDRVGTDLDYF